MKKYSLSEYNFATQHSIPLFLRNTHLCLLCLPVYVILTDIFATILPKIRQCIEPNSDSVFKFGMLKSINQTRNNNFNKNSIIIIVYE